MALGHEMSKDLGFTNTEFGFRAGIFFLAFFIFEVPSNLLLEKVGARRWIARIMVSWGIVAIGTAFVTGSWSFYGVGFLLGAAEAGFFPGVILYLTYWFPREHRARVVGVFMLAIPVSTFLGSPNSGLILDLDRVMDLRGWQWLFILEALPAILLGALVLVWLPDKPSTAVWLAPAQRE